ncbi:MAG: hypothetical protein LCH95_24125 [Proteobacteria bacterium]|nr:hypothetical protein [Pseudomonadota bacterium]
MVDTPKQRAGAGFLFELLDGGNSFKLTLPPIAINAIASAPVSISVELSIEQLDSLIEGLGTQRAAASVRQPQEPMSPPPTALDPKWLTSDDPLTGNSVVQLCHPNTGWLQFEFPPTEAAKLGRLLQDQAQLARAPRRPN